jgi:hypothetical protein
VSSDAQRSHLSRVQDVVETAFEITLPDPAIQPDLGIESTKSADNKFVKRAVRNTGSTEV